MSITEDDDGELLEEQEHKGYGEDEGERDESLPDEESPNGPDADE